MAKQNKKEKKETSKESKPVSQKEDAYELAKRKGVSDFDYLIIRDRGGYMKDYKTTEEQLKKDYKKFILGK